MNGQVARKRERSQYLERQIQKDISLFYRIAFTTILFYYFINVDVKRVFKLSARYV